MQALIMVGINLLLSAALWGVGMLLRRRTHTTVGEIKDREVQISTYGAPKALLYGQCKSALSLVWAAKLQPVYITQEVGKGGGSTVTQTYYICDWAGILGVAPDPAVFGELKLLKLWTDDKLRYNATADNDKVKQGKWCAKKLKFYPGTATQLPDPTMEAALGAGNVPAYRHRPLIVIKDKNVTEFGNRIPTVRALVAPAEATALGMYPVTGIIQLDPDDDYPIGEYDNAGMIMSADEQWIILGYSWDDPDTYEPRFTWHKISTAERKSIVYQTYEYPEPDCNAIETPFFPFQAFDLDELQRIYAPSCEGYGKVVRLDSDTFTIQASGPEVQPYAVQIERIRVSRNPLYPYCYVWATGVWTTDIIYLLHRDTLASPFDSGSYGYELEAPVTGMSCQAACLNHQNGSLFVLWGKNSPVTAYCSRLYPDGRREDTDITAQLNGLTSVSKLRDNLCYDQDSDQLIIGSFYSLGDDVLWILDAATLTQNYKIANCGPYYDNSIVDFDRGVVGGYFHMLRANDVLKIDVNTGEIVETYDTSALLDPGIDIEGILYCSYKESVFGLIRDSGVDMQEILLGRLTVGTAGLNDVISDICQRDGLSAGQLNVAQLTDEVKGYMVNQDQSAREALEPLMEAFIFDGVEQDGVLTFVKRGGAAAATIPEADLAAFVSGGERPEPLEIEFPEETELPRRVEVHFPNQGRKHESGVQHYGRQVTDSKLIKKIQTPVLMDDDQAKQLAHVALKYAWQAKPVKLPLGPKYARLMPTDVVTVQKSEGDYRVLLLEAQREGLLTHWQGIIEDLEYTSAAQGAPGPDVDEDVDFPGPSLYQLLDLPPLRDSHNGAGVYLASGALFDDWSGCEVWVSKDGGDTFAFLKAVAERAVTGAAVTALNDHEYVVRDRHSSLTVRWDKAGDALASVTESQQLQGQGHYLAVIKANGDIEIVCARDVTTNGDGTQTLTTLIRGVKGTEHARSGHTAGEKVVVLTASTVILAALDATYLNQSYLYHGLSRGEEWEDGSRRIFTTGLHTLKPWSPVQPVGTRDGSNNLTINARRRNRLYGLNELLTGNAIPMSEASEAYEVDFYDGDTVVRTVDGLTTPDVSYSAAEQTADGLTPGEPVIFKMYMMSAVVGRGRPLEATV